MLYTIDNLANEQHGLNASCIGSCVMIDCYIEMFRRHIFWRKLSKEKL